MTLRYEKLTGPALKAVIPDLAALRIAVFRDWPYLYEGSREYEETYLARYAENPRAIVIGAYDGVRLVGASTATPLASEIEEFRAPFEKHGYDVSRVFYFGESILLPDYRGQGAGHVFFDEREAQARAAGGDRLYRVLRGQAGRGRSAQAERLPGRWTRSGTRAGTARCWAWKRSFPGARSARSAKARSRCSSGCARSSAAGTAAGQWPGGCRRAGSPCQPQLAQLLGDAFEGLDQVVG